MTSKTALAETTEQRALRYLRSFATGTTAGELGSYLWPKRRGRAVSSNGGGDYAAQMLLGRLRKKGLVYVLRGEGSSRWSVCATASLVEEKK
jgi:hypothetical protein